MSTDKPEHFYIDKQSWALNTLKDETQCHWTLIAKNPKDKSGNYMIHVIEHVAYEQLKAERVLLAFELETVKAQRDRAMVERNKLQAVLVLERRGRG